MEIISSLINKYSNIFLIIILMQYIIFVPIALYALSRKTNIPYCIFAFVPVLNLYFLGRFAYGKLMGLVCFIFSALVCLSVLNILTTNYFNYFVNSFIFFTALSVIRTYSLTSKHPMLLTFLSIISCGTLVPIFLLGVSTTDTIY